jgi:hypothetical protein
MQGPLTEYEVIPLTQGGVTDDLRLFMRGLIRGFRSSARNVIVPGNVIGWHVT